MEIENQWFRVSSSAPVTQQNVLLHTGLDCFIVAQHGGTLTVCIYRFHLVCPVLA